MTTKAVIFGATGQTGRYVVRRFMKLDDIELTLFVRSPHKLADQGIVDDNGRPTYERLHIVKGDATDPADVRRAVEGQEVVIASLEGDVLTMARILATEAKKAGGMQDPLDHRHGASTMRSAGSTA